MDTTVSDSSSRASDNLVSAISSGTGASLNSSATNSIKKQLDEQQQTTALGTIDGVLDGETNEVTLKNKALKMGKQSKESNSKVNMKSGSISTPKNLGGIVETDSFQYVASE